jgi:hypothetical protein
MITTALYRPMTHANDPCQSSANPLLPRRSKATLRHALQDPGSEQDTELSHSHSIVTTSQQMWRRSVTYHYQGILLQRSVRLPARNRLQGLVLVRASMLMGTTSCLPRRTETVQSSNSHAETSAAKGRNGREASRTATLACSSHTTQDANQHLTMSSRVVR